MHRRGPGRTRTMVEAGEYWIEGCQICGHPGGVHRIDRWEPRVEHCLGGDNCPAFVPGDYVRWSDALTRELAETGISRSPGCSGAGASLGAASGT